MCAWSPKDSRIQMSADLEKRINEAQSAEAITEILRDAMCDQGLIKVDEINHSVWHEVQQPQPTALARVVTINGKKYSIEGKDELELEKATGELYRQVFAAAPPTQQTQQTQQTRDPQTGKFVSPQEPTSTVDDATRLAAEAAARATEQHLASLGIDVEAVRELSDKKFEDKWVTATEQFRQKHPEWQGGEENKVTLGELIAENDLIDTADPLAAMEQAYQHMQEHDLIVESPEMTYANEIAAATDQTQIDEINARFFPNTRVGAQASGMFGRR